MIERLLKKLSAYFAPLLKNNTTVMPDGKSTSATDLSDYSEYDARSGFYECSFRWCRYW